eukprot:TRINITY_DN439_c2_g1_i2.p1 TRINITY_DN439_c2_g1~~TRINITY_DN439_c2_g1_i2.p1  ORF type:complete len:290 (+),score=103.36 TRINITY_DN439_c2_g1_i2:573-1442(+)
MHAWLRSANKRKAADVKNKKKTAAKDKGSGKKKEAEKAKKEAEKARKVAEKEAEKLAAKEKKEAEKARKAAEKKEEAEAKKEAKKKEAEEKKAEREEEKTRKGELQAKYPGLTWEEVLLFELYEAAGLEPPKLLEDHEQKLKDFEKEIHMKVPKQYRALMKYNHEGPFLISSLDSEEISQQYSYNSEHKRGIYIRCNLIPFGQIDYDFCFKVWDAQTGHIILLDLECRVIQLLASSIANYLEHLLTLTRRHMASGKKEDLRSVISYSSFPKTAKMRPFVCFTAKKYMYG